jgi:hypothetical protein
MSIKEQAFELFNQGKRPSDPELKALKLKTGTLYDYFQKWKKNGGNFKPSGTQTKELSTKEQPLHTFVVGDERVMLYRVDIDDAYDQYRDIRAMGAEGDFSSFIRVACQYMRAIYQSGNRGSPSPE